MFLTSLNTSPLVGTAADEIFAHITGDTYRGDVSFISAMRMLLYDRLPEGSSANVKFVESNYSSVKGIAAKEGEVLFRNLTGHSGDLPENQIWFVDVKCDSKDETNSAFKNFAKVKDLCGMKPDLPVDNMVAALTQSHTYIDFENCRTVVLIFDRANTAKWHAFAALTSRFFKKYFDGDKVITDYEKDHIANGLIKETTPDKFRFAMSEFAKRFDFRSPMIKASLRGFENRNLKDRIANMDRELASKLSQLEDANRQYSQLLRQKIELEEKRTALSLNIKEEKNELMEYFLANKNLYLADANGDTITFFVKTVWGNYDPDLAERTITHPERHERSNLYTCGPSSVKKADRDLLFKALMLDRKIRLWQYGKFSLSVSGSEPIQAYRDFEQPDEMMDACPNPHLFRHRCMGNNQRHAIDCVYSGDYVTAVEQCIGAVASVNLAESVTTDPWMNLLLSDKYGRIFETTDGRRMNFTDVMKYLKEEAYA